MISIKQLPLSEFITAFSPVDAPSWTELLTIYLTDELHLERITELKQELLRNNSFREPIVVDSAIGMISNGQHRTVTSILAGEEGIEFSEEALPNMSLIEFEISLDIKEELSEKAVERLFGTLMSFRVSDDYWAECFGAITMGRLSLTTDCPPSELAPLLQTIRKRIARIGLTLKELHCSVASND